MEYNSERLHDGLYMMCRGELVGLIGLLIGLVLLLIPVLGLLCLAAALVGTAVSVVGQFKLCGEHKGYKIALILTVIGVLLNLSEQYGPIGIAGVSPAVLSVIISLLGLACFLGRAYFLIRTTNGFLARRGRDDLVEKGRKTLIIYVVCSVASCALGELPDWSGDRLGPLAAAAVIVSLLGIISTWVKLRYLRQSADVFQ